MAKEGFDDARQFWDKRYATPEYIFGVEPNAFLAANREYFKPGMRVLDIACGEGRNSVWLAEQGCVVTGIDLSPLALDKARDLAARRGMHVEFEEADLHQWSWPVNRFDAVTSIFIQFAAPEGRQMLFDRMFDALKVDGLLFVQGFTPAQLQYSSGGPKEISHLYTGEMLRGLVRRAQVLHLREYEDELSEGSKHVGRAALVELVARKAG